MSRKLGHAKGSAKNRPKVLSHSVRGNFSRGGMRTVSRDVDSTCIEVRTYDDDDKLVDIRKVMKPAIVKPGRAHGRSPVPEFRD